MRSADKALPTIGGDRPETERWPARLYIGLERQPVGTYVYDDFTATYSHQPPYLYDYTGTWPFDRFDLFCYFQGLTITSGGQTPSPNGLMDAAHVEMTLNDRDGTLSQYDAQGRLVDWLPGSKLDIWATIGGVGYWLFSGQVTAWRERADSTIDVEAYDAFSILSEEAANWGPGNYNDTPGQRLGNILTLFGYTGRTRLDSGTVRLHNFLTSATPLAEMQAVAMSDAGVLFVDADGTVVYANRTWSSGRSDQPSIPTFSDNVCATPAVVWDAVMTTDDDNTVNKVSLTNVAGQVVTSTNATSLARVGPQSFVRTNDQWNTVAAGQAVADAIIANSADTYLRLEQFALYLNDPQQDLWLLAIDRRIGDLLVWSHEQPTTTGAAQLALNVVVRSIVHEITPEQWVATIGTTRTVSSKVALRYDRTTFHYNDADPRVIYV